MTSPHDDPGFRRLLQFSEWLDMEGLMILPEDSGDERGHEQLVSDFLAWRETNR